jgi:hypothetical protein
MAERSQVAIAGAGPAGLLPCPAHRPSVAGMRQTQ